MFTRTHRNQCRSRNRNAISIYGHPELPKTNFSFTPIPNYGSKNPKLQNQLCHGSDLRNIDYPKKIELQWLIQAYRDFPDKNIFSKRDSTESQVTKGYKYNWLKDWVKSKFVKLGKRI